MRVDSWRLSRSLDEVAWVFSTLCAGVDKEAIDGGLAKWDGAACAQLVTNLGLPQYAEHGSAQSKVWKGPTLRYRKIQDLEQDPLYLEYMGLPIFRDVTRKIIAEEVSLYRTMFFK